MIDVTRSNSATKVSTAFEAPHDEQSNLVPHPIEPRNVSNVFHVEEKANLGRRSRQPYLVKLLEELGQLPLPADADEGKYSILCP